MCNTYTNHLGLQVPLLVHVRVLNLRLAILSPTLQLTINSYCTVVVPTCLDLYCVGLEHKWHLSLAKLVVTPTLEVTSTGSARMPPARRDLPREFGYHVGYLGVDTPAVDVVVSLDCASEVCAGFGHVGVCFERGWHTCLAVSVVTPTLELANTEV